MNVFNTLATFSFILATLSIILALSITAAVLPGSALPVCPPAVSLPIMYSKLYELQLFKLLPDINPA